MFRNQQVDKVLSECSCMNRYTLLILGILTVMMVVSVVSAHPPSDLNLTYDKSSGNLSATFTHQVADPTTHFVKNVKVTVDGKEVLNENYTSQPTADVFTYVYPINASPNSVIDVIGHCNILGSKENSITV
jgi:hypothetical protein